MQYCQHCGSPVEGKFCVVCGAAVVEQKPFEVKVDVSDIPDAPPAVPLQQAAAQTPPPAYGAPAPTYGVPAYVYPPQYPVYTAEPQTQPISVGGWIGRSLIPYIPVVGGLVYLIMLFIWMGDETKEETFRNWAKAQLIVMLIIIGLVLFLWVLVFVLIGISIPVLM